MAKFRMSSTALILFFSLFFAVGIGLLAYAGYSAMRSKEAGTWPVAEGRLLSADLKSNSDSEGSTTYQVKVSYQYAVDGMTYTGDRLAFGYGGSSGQSAHQDILDKLRSGETVEVRYSPTDPQVSALSFGFHRSMQFMVAFGVTWLLFTSGMAFMFWLFSKPDQVLLNNLIVH